MHDHLPKLTVQQSNIVNKSFRLVSEGRVHRVHDRIYRVEGDTGVYLVAVADRDALSATLHRGTGTPGPDGVCSCPATGECSHLLAARTLQRRVDEPDPFAGVL
jgi:hypothetical protein